MSTLNAGLRHRGCTAISPYPVTSPLAITMGFCRMRGSARQYADAMEALEAAPVAGSEAPGVDEELICQLRPNAGPA